MNDKDRELLAQILSAGGSAAKEGFAQLVHWQFVDGLAVFLTCLTVIIAGAFVFRALWRWKPEDDCDNLVSLVRGAGLVLTCIICAIVATNGLANGLRDMLAPEGAAVAWLTAHR